MKTNIEVHFFRGDPTKGQERWMYSIRDNGGYYRCDKGAGTFIAAALKAACEIEGFAERYEDIKTAVGSALRVLRCPKCSGYVKRIVYPSDHLKCVQCDWIGADTDCVKE